MRILLMYHFFHPDGVVSARLFSDLAADLAAAGHRVTVYTGRHLLRGEASLPAREVWRGVEIRRFRRLPLNQGRHLGRLLNSLVLQVLWLCAYLRQCRSFDAVVLGTDPQFGYLLLPWLRWCCRRVRLIHWVFDLYPEVIEASAGGIVKKAAGWFQRVAGWAYRRADWMVDIGPCMRDRLQQYRHGGGCLSLTPWALAEPEQVPAADATVREELFGRARMGILYSGTVGYAHDLTPFIDLARECRRRGYDIGFCFAGYGNQYQAQTAGLTAADSNVRLAGFASEEELEKRLAAADFHMISLRHGWEGVVVPSKFFGALAMGRPVLYSGPSGSCLARWCQSENIGYAFEAGTVGALADRLGELLKQPVEMEELRTRAWSVYREKFSRQAVVGGWKALFSQLERTAAGD